MPLRVRPSVLGLTPYSPGKPLEEAERETGGRGFVKLASNENPLGPSPRAIEAIRASAGLVHLYPDSSAQELRAALSSKFKIPSEQVVAGSGSDELIHYIGLALLEPGDEVVVAHPSFIRYDAVASMCGATVTRVPLDVDYRHELRAMAEAVTERTKILWIANPNNPTGTIVDRAEFEALMEAVGDDVLVVLDEAYFDFVDSEDNPNSLDYVRAGRNVAGLRTFSKSHGLAGLRAGYGFLPVEMADAVNRLRMPFNANVLAQKAGLAALEDDDHLTRTVELNRRGLARLSAVCRSNGATVAESYGNFVWADFGRPTAALVDAMLRKGVIIRGGSVFGMPDCVRISVGTDEEMDRFEAALEEAMAESYDRQPK